MKTRIKKRNKDLILTGFETSIVNSMLLEEGKELEVNVSLVDKRAISEQQRKFIFALCRLYEYETGSDSEMFRGTMMQVTDDMFDLKKKSLSLYTMSDANKLIDNIIYSLIQLDIPISGQLIKDNEYHFNTKQTYIMCLKRICVVCGKRADLHHVDAVGMRSRDKISHLGMRMLPLCREHHVMAHSKGNEYMIEKYHLTPIVIDEKLEHFIKKGNMKTYKE